MLNFDFVSYKNQLEACRKTWGLVPHPTFERLQAPSGLPMTTPWSVCAVGRKAEPEAARNFNSLARTETPVLAPARVHFPEFDTQQPTRSISRAIDTIETDREEHRRAEEEARRQTLPRAEIKSVWTNYDARRGGRDGMLIHTQFTTANLETEELSAIASVYYDGTQRPVESAEEAFCATDGTLCVSDFLRPRYRNGLYQDFRLFLPLDAFRIHGSGLWKLKFEVVIRRVEPTWAVLTRSPWQNFEFRLAD